MHKLLNNSWEYIQEPYSDVSSRYKGFGSKLFGVMSSSLPLHYQNLKFYRSISNQTEDVFAICEGLGHDYGIQLDPDCEAICLWDDKTHIEIGYWSEDEYIESVEFIKANFQQ
ncbi:hypothetical protein [Motilimonas sp. E26]|uniref:hypothetical protein n=1 Tax=Motilimonas sp. E26 TaxID=2865674 RepID=UPI001E3E6AF6|nr:hypothetical protein [Motilimonas sp. E26]MCE0559426.1 hypothetical protein [Motilimonas sp. E26]